ncbi:hypothetical protein SAMN02746062_01858 [Alysiella filiformis DSM 16848]|uniref:Uncharacterized protein n=1 Tax=Alysiella filiformis DSM 16848 TaxID=1120981 RepID=A0A286EFZ0_9NEIS|nr:hypothetical protein SAMN02746062_01858 [Alysiella filiformis DSM 16848]
MRCRFRQPENLNPHHIKNTACMITSGDCFDKLTHQLINQFFHAFDFVDL